MSETPHAAHGPEEGADPKVGITLVVGALGVILTVVIILALQVLFYRTAQREFVTKVVEVGSEKLRNAESAQREMLEGYRWVDRENGVVALPIERAMELIVEESQGR
jgi:hypothetical protein